MEGIVAAADNHHHTEVDLKAGSRTLRVKMVYSEDKGGLSQAM